MNLDKDIVSACNAKSLERRGTGFLTAAESRDILANYISDNNLIDKDSKKFVIVDGPMGDALWGLTKKEKQMQSANQKSNERPEKIDRKKLQEAWTAKLDRGYALVIMPGSKIMTLKRGKPPQITIDIERRQGNRKYTTRVRGLEEVCINLR